MVTKQAQRHGLRVRKLAGEPGSGPHYPDHVTGEPSARPFAGVAFLDERLNRTDQPPKHIRVPHDFVSREPWIETVGTKGVVKPAGPSANPFAKTHTFVHADELVLHMADGDYRYKVVGQPDKYDAAGKPTDAAGDPETEVRWFYDADLIGKV